MQSRTGSWRRHIKLLILGSVFTILLVACQGITQSQAPDASPVSEEQTETADESPEAAGRLELPPLPYAYDALEPYIDAETMELHHDRHHATYVNNYNDAVADAPELRDQGVENLLRNLDAIPEDVRITIRNNGGGHINHSMFWQIMSPDGGGEPEGELAERINQTFGSFAEFQAAFEEAGTRQFGSGWVWLVANNGDLQITTTLNQDNPIMTGAFPIMGNDVWEHAYYLNYRNRRAEYLNAWWNVVNWDAVAQRYEQSQQG
ncbi:superoxide dismutase [Egbenema bharatensis]|uniref:superoxide dismutase n=1 Tax=Egbenema bharatensis TaxID=3463334 RepID=UPI003A8A11E0